MTEASASLMVVDDDEDILGERTDSLCSKARATTLPPPRMGSRRGNGSRQASPPR